MICVIYYWEIAHDLCYLLSCLFLFLFIPFSLLLSLFLLLFFLSFSLFSLSVVQSM